MKLSTYCCQFCSINNRMNFWFCRWHDTVLKLILLTFRNLIKMAAIIREATIKHKKHFLQCQTWRRYIFITHAHLPVFKIRTHHHFLHIFWRFVIYLIGRMPVTPTKKPYTVNLGVPNDVWCWSWRDMVANCEVLTSPVAFVSTGLFPAALVFTFYHGAYLINRAKRVFWFTLFAVGGHLSHAHLSVFEIQTHHHFSRSKQNGPHINWKKRIPWNNGMSASVMKLEVDVRSDMVANCKVLTPPVAFVSAGLLTAAVDFKRWLVVFALLFNSALVALIAQNPPFGLVIFTVDGWCTPVTLKFEKVTGTISRRIMPKNRRPGPQKRKLCVKRLKSVRTLSDAVPALISDTAASSPPRRSQRLLQKHSTFAHILNRYEQTKGADGYDVVRSIRVKIFKEAAVVDLISAGLYCDSGEKNAMEARGRQEQRAPLQVVPPNEWVYRTPENQKGNAPQPKATKNRQIPREFVMLDTTSSKNNTILYETKENFDMELALATHRGGLVDFDVGSVRNTVRFPREEAAGGDDFFKEVRQMAVARSFVQTNNDAHSLLRCNQQQQRKTNVCATVCLESLVLIQ